MYVVHTSIIRTQRTCVLKLCGWRQSFSVDVSQTLPKECASICVRCARVVSANAKRSGAPVNGRNRAIFALSHKKEILLQSVFGAYIVPHKPHTRHMSIYRVHTPSAEIPKYIHQNSQNARIHSETLYTPEHIIRHPHHTHTLLHLHTNRNQRLSGFSGMCNMWLLDAHTTDKQKICVWFLVCCDVV